MVRFLITRPIAVLSSTLVFLILGIVSGFKMPVSLLPEAEIPEITVRVSYPDYEPQQLEADIVSPLRISLQQINGLRSIESETSNNESIIKLLFNHETDIRLATIEVNEKIDEIYPTFPRNIQRPLVCRKTSSDIPIFHINITYDSIDGIFGRDFHQLSDYVDNVIRRRIEQTSEIALVDISGLVKKVINLIPDDEMLRSYNISYEDILQQINNYSINPGNYTIKNGQYVINVGFEDGLTNVEDIKNVFIKKNDQIFQIKDIADVIMNTENPDGYNIHNGMQGITLAVYKNPNSRMEKAKETVERVIANLKSENPELEFQITRDQSRLLKYSIKSLRQSLYLGILCAAFVMFLLMQRKKLPLLIIISIPVSLISSMFILDLFGVSINIISLSGLILGVGMMIDNSIIVIDNIDQYREKGVSCAESCVRGTNEVIRPLISSVLTTCSVFIPLVFLSGISGALFFDQAIAVSVSLFVSFFVSIVIIPVLFYLVFSSDGDKITAATGSNTIKFIYERTLLIMLNRKVVFTVLFFLLIPLGILLFMVIKKELFPSMKETEMITKIYWKEPVSADENKKRILKLFENMNDLEFDYTAFIGKTQFMFGETTGQTTSESSVYIKATHDRGLDQVKKVIRQRLEYLYPFASISYYSVENIFNQIFKEDETPLQARLRMTKRNDENIGLLHNLADTIINNHNSVLSENTEAENYIFLITIDFKKMYLYDIGFNEIISKLRTILGRNKIGALLVNNSHININISSEDQYLLSKIKSSFIKSKNDNWLPVSNFITVDRVLVANQIYSDNLGWYYPVNINADNQNYIDIIKSIEKKLIKYVDIFVSWNGSIVNNNKLFKELLFVLIISLLLLYFILAAQFESLVQPVIVLLEVVFDISGSFLLLYLVNSSINVMAVIGIVVMSGIVINDSILKVDTINRLRRSGMNLRDAVLTGGMKRLKPILMTSITTILALLPMLFMTGIGVELQTPFALAVIGGLFTGTIVSLFFIPLIYELIYNKSANS